MKIIKKEIHSSNPDAQKKKTSQKAKELPAKKKQLASLENQLNKLPDTPIGQETDNLETLMQCI